MTSIIVGGGLGLDGSSATQTNGYGASGAAGIGQGSDGAYVDAATGNLVLQGQDQFISAVGLSDTLTRTYNSLGLIDGDNNDGWRISAYRSLEISGGTGPITRTEADGHQAIFTYNATLGEWRDSSEGSGTYDVIKQIGSQYQYIQGGTRLTETYDSSGTLLSAQDSDGNTLTYHYSGSLISSITDGSGQTTYLDYSGTQLSDIRVVGYAPGATSGSPTQTLIDVRYGYDGQGRLNQVQVDLSPADGSVSDGNVYTTTYQYDGSSTRVSHIAQSDGSSLSISYVEVDGSERVLTLTDGDDHTTSFHYDTANGVTTVTDPLGNATAYTYDTDGRLTQVTQPAVDGATASIHYSYDADGNISQVTDAAGRVVTYTHDSNGNLTRTQDSLGDTVDRTYDASGQLLSQTVYTVPDPDGSGSGQPSGAETTYYVYDSHEHLAYVITPRGDVTQYTYNAKGERSSAVRYLGGTYSTSSQPTLAQLNSWASGQGSGNTQRSDSSYDLSGQILSVTTYSGPGTTGTASTSHYLYDSNGRLQLKADGRATTLAAGQADVTSYVYDGLGRLTSTQDGAGLITTYHYDDAGNTLTTTTAAGLVTTSVFDPAGELTSVSRSGSGVVTGTTTYAYDTDGRLVMQTDPTGARTFYVYDARGRQVGVVAPDGELTETVYNDDNQVIRTIQYAGRVDTSTLVDANGNPLPVDLVDLRGGTRADAAPTVDLDGSDATVPGMDYRTTYTTAGATLAAVGSDLTVGDADSATLSSAQIKLVDRPDGSNESLAVTVGSTGISASYNASTGVLSLSGNKSVAAYQQVLRTLTYRDAAATPTDGDRRIDISVNDGSTSSNIATAVVTVTATGTPVDQAPVLDLNGSASGTGYSVTAGGPGSTTAIVSSSLTVSDADNTSLASATAQITDASGTMTLSATTTGTPVTASYNASTHTLTLSGTATVAQYQQVLRTLSLSYASAPASATAYHVNVSVSDGQLSSTVATSVVTVPAAVVDQAPVLDLNGSASGTGYSVTATGGGASTLIVSSSLTVSDTDNTNLAGATAQITDPAGGISQTLSVTTTGTPITASYNASTHTLTLSGTATVAQYQQVLRTLTYTDSAALAGSAQYHVNVSISDGQKSSAVATSVVTVPAAVVDQAPVLDLNGSASGTGYSVTAGGPGSTTAIVSSSLTVSDADNTSLASATAQITDASGTMTLSATTTGTPITASYNSSTYTLTLSGSATVAQYQQVLRTLSLSYATAPASATAYHVNVSVNDGQKSSAVATSVVTVPAAVVDQAPVLDLNGPASGTGYSVTTAHGGTATVIVSSGLTVSDSDSTNLTGATAQITDPASGITQTLSVTTTGTPITASYNASTHTLSLSGTATVAQYQQVLRTLTYTDSAALAGSAQYHVNVSVSDGQKSSAVATSVVTVPADQAPTVDLNGPGYGVDSETTAGSADQTVVIADPSLTVGDVDSAYLTSATAHITNALGLMTQTLAVDTTGTPITASYDITTHTLSLTGTATVAQYQQVLRTLSYTHSAALLDIAQYQVAITVNDGQQDSNAGTIYIDYSSSEAAPVIDLNGSAAGSDNEVSGAAAGQSVQLAPSTTVTDADSPSLVSATAVITNPSGSGQTLSVDVGSTPIVASYNATTHTLTLNGRATAAQYQQVLETLSYNHTTADTTQYQVQVTVNDGEKDSNVASIYIDHAGTDAAPVVDLNGSASGTDYEVTAGSAGQTVGIVSPDLTVSDSDTVYLLSASAQITNPPPLITQTLSVDTSGTPITASYASHTLTLTGRATAAEYQQVLRTLSYEHSAMYFNTTQFHVAVTVNDGQTSSNVANIYIDPPGTVQSSSVTAQSFALQSGAAPAALSTDSVASPQVQAVPQSVSVTTSASQGDPNNRTTSDFYDAAGRLAYSVDAAGDVTGYTYDGTGQLVSQTRYATALSSVPTSGQASDIHVTTNGTDRTTRYFYDADGNQTGTLDAQGYLTETVYDNAGEVQQRIAYATLTSSSLRASGTLAQLRPAADASHDQHSWTLYDGQGRIAAQIDADGYLTAYGYDAAGNRTQQTRYTHAVSDTGSQTLSTLITAATGPQDQTTHSQYDGDNRVTQTTDAQGTVTRYTYNTTTGFLSSVVSAYNQTDALGRSDARSTGYSYDAAGDVLTVTNGLSGVTHSTYDAAGRKIRSVDPDGHQTVYYYNDDSQLAYTVDGAGDVSGYQYDAFGDVVAATQYATPIATGSLTGGTVAGDSAFASAIGASGFQTNAANRSVTTAYNSRGLVSQQTDALGFITTDSYDAFGELKTQVGDIGVTPGALHRTDTYAYNADGDQTQRVIDSGGLALTTGVQYDAFGRATQVTDPNGNITTTQYDGLGRTVQVTGNATNAAGASVAYHASSTYDAFGRVLTQTDRAGATTHYSYDDATQTLTTTTQGGIVVTTVSNRHGQTIRLTDGAGGATTYTYDADGNLTLTQDPDGNQTHQAYDPADLLSSTTDADGVQTTYTYDGASRVLTRIVDPGDLHLLTQYAYDTAGNTVRVTDANNIITETVFDKAGQATHVIVDTAGKKLATSYTYDGQGDQLSVLEGQQATGSTGNWTYGAADKTTNYSYDKAGRLKTQVVDPGTGDHLNLTTAYAYDADSNLTRTTDANNNVWRYAYDAANRQIYAVDPTGGVTESDYDGDGRVIRSVQYATPINTSSLTDASKPAAIKALIQPGTGQDRDTLQVYDSDGRLTYTIDALGDVTGYQYDGANRITDTTRYATALTAMQLSDLGTDLLSAPLTPGQVQALLTSSNPQNQSSHTVYDAAGRAVYTVDALNDLVQNVYDPTGNLIQTRAYAAPLPAATPLTQAGIDTQLASAQTVRNDATDRVTRYVYDDAGRQVYELDTISGSSTNYMAYVVQNGYDKDGRVTDKYRYAKAMSFTSDVPTVTAVASVVGNHLDSSHDQHDHSSYDGAGRLTEFDDADGNSQKYSYDALGNKLTYTNQNGAIWSYHYDGAGRLTEQDSPTTTLYTPGTVSAPAPAAYSGKTVTRITYDGLGNVKTRTEGDIVDGQSTFNALRQTQYGYDALGRQTSTTEPAVSDIYNPDTDATAGYVGNNVTGATPTTTTTYNALGDAVVSQDTAGNDSYKVYDGLGRVQYAVDADGDVTGYAYDAFGNQTQLTRYANAISTSGHSAGTAYTAAQLQAALSSSALDRTITTQYDALDRKSSVIQPQVFTYDATSQTYATASPTTDFLYDAFGDQTEQSQLQDVASGVDHFSTTYSYYDRLGNRSAQIDPMGYLTQWQYSATGQMTDQKEWANALAAGSWSSSGFTAPTAVGASTGSTLASRSYSNVRETQYAYDRLGQQLGETRIGTVKTTVNSSGQIQNTVGDEVIQQTAYDGVGNVISSTDATGAATLSFYDALGNLVDVTGPAHSAQITPGSTATTMLESLTAYQYDALGDQLSQTRYASGTQRTAAQASPTDLPAPTQPSAVDDATTYDFYDVLGRVTQSLDADGNLSYTSYDRAGHVAKTEQDFARADGSTGHKVQIYQYDGDGEQVSEADRLESGALADHTTTYDAFGEVIARGLSGGNASDVTTVDGVTGQYVYDNDGRLVYANDTGAGTAYLSDLQGNTTARIQSATVDLGTYFGAGNTTHSPEAVAELSSGMRRTETVYDADNRAVEQRQASFTEAPFQLPANEDTLAGQAVVAVTNGTSTTTLTVKTLDGAMPSLQIAPVGSTQWTNVTLTLTTSGISQTWQGTVSSSLIGNYQYRISYTVPGQSQPIEQGTGVVDLGDVTQGLTLSTTTVGGVPYLVFTGSSGYSLSGLVAMDVRSLSSGINNVPPIAGVVRYAVTTVGMPAGSYGIPLPDNHQLLSFTPVFAAGGPNPSVTATKYYAPAQSATATSAAQALLNGLFQGALPVSALPSSLVLSSFQYKPGNSGQYESYSTASSAISGEVSLLDFLSADPLPSIDFKVRFTTASGTPIDFSQIKINGQAIGDDSGYVYGTYLTDARSGQDFSATPPASFPSTTYTPTQTETLDRWGNVLSSATYATSDESGAPLIQSQYRYDDFNRAIEQTQAAVQSYSDSGSSITVTPTSEAAFDGDGRQIASQDANGNLSSRQYDAAGELVSQRDGAGHTTAYGYNALGEQASRTDADGNLTQYRYDRKGQLTSEIDPATTETYGYDALGDRVNDNGQTSYVYDGFGHVLSQTQLAYTYQDPISGQTVSVQQKTATVYDALGDKIKQTDGNGNAYTWSYNRYGQEVTSTGLSTGSTAGNTTTYRYDDAGEKTEDDLSIGGQTYATLYSYYANGLLASVFDPGRDDLAAYAADSPAYGQPYRESRTDYSYDAAGRLIHTRFDEMRQDQLGTLDTLEGWTSPDQDTLYRYDADGRLQTLTDPNAVVDYFYDAQGNRKLIQAQTKLATGASNDHRTIDDYDADNRVIDTLDADVIRGPYGTGPATGLANATGTALQYDGAGNREGETDWTQPAGTTLSVSGNSDAQIDAAINSEIETSSNGPVSFTYGYDGNNRLADSYKGGVHASHRVYNSLDQVSEYDSYGSNGTISSTQQDSYYADGTLAQVRDLDSNGHLTETQAYDYDDASNVQLSTIANAQGTYVGAYQYQYQQGIGGYEQTQIAAQTPGSSSVNTTIELYDLHGNLTVVHGNVSGTEELTNDASGHILYKLSPANASTAFDDHLLYLGDQEVGSSATTFTAGGVAGVTVHFGNTPTPISDQYPDISPGQYVVNSGDTLQSIAQQVYGDASLWYVIADANSVGENSTLVAGTVLTLPNRVIDAHNTSNTFQPYNPTQIVGNINPPLPPPPSAHQCNFLATILIAAVVIIATIYTAGAADTLLAGSGAAAGGAAAGTAGTFATGVGVLTGAAGLGTTTLAAAAIGGAVGSLAGQVVGDALGVSSGINLAGIGVGALTAGATAGIGGVIGGAGLGSLETGLAEGGLDSIADQGIGVALGTQRSFSWSSVVADSIVSGAFVGAGAEIHPLNAYAGIQPQSFSAGELLGRTAEGIVSSAATTELTVALGGHGRIDFANVAADSFGNALGDSIVGQIEYTDAEQQQQKQQQAQEAQGQENAGGGGPMQAIQQQADMYSRLYQQYGEDGVTLAPADYAVPPGGGSGSLGATNDQGVPLTGTPGTSVLAGSTTYYYDNNGNAQIEPGLTIHPGAAQSVSSVNPAVSDAQLEAMGAENGAQAPGFFSNLLNGVEGVATEVGNEISSFAQQVGSGIESLFSGHGVSDLAYYPGPIPNAQYNLGAASLPVNAALNTINALPNAALDVAGAGLRVASPVLNFVANHQGEMVTAEVNGLSLAPPLEGLAIAGTTVLGGVAGVLGRVGEAAGEGEQVAQGVSAEQATFARASAEGSSAEALNAQQANRLAAHQNAAEAVATNTASAIGDTQAGSELVTTFRGVRSSLTPDSVFQNGLVPKGDNLDLLRHVTATQSDSGFVATSQSLDVGQGFAGRNGYVYEVVPEGGINVNEALGSASPFPEQLEVAIPGPVAPTNVLGAYPLRGGVPTGEFIPNPFFGAKVPE